jgi:isochorismate synthase EntC
MTIIRSQHQQALLHHSRTLMRDTWSQWCMIAKKRMTMTHLSQIMMARRTKRLLHNHIQEWYMLLLVSLTFDDSFAFDHRLLVWG